MGKIQFKAFKNSAAEFPGASLRPIVMVRSLWGVIICVAMCAEALHTPWSMPSRSKPTPMLRRTATMQLMESSQTVAVTGKELTLKLVVQDEEKSVPIAAAAAFAISSFLLHVPLLLVPILLAPTYSKTSEAVPEATPEAAPAETPKSEASEAFTFSRPLAVRSSIMLSESTVEEKPPKADSTPTAADLSNKLEALASKLEQKSSTPDAPAIAKTDKKASISSTAVAMQELDAMASRRAAQRKASRGNGGELSFGASYVFSQRDGGAPLSGGLLVVWRVARATGWTLLVAIAMVVLGMPLTRQRLVELMGASASLGMKTLVTLLAGVPAQIAAAPAQAQELAQAAVASSRAFAQHSSELISRIPSSYAWQAAEAAATSVGQSAASACQAVWSGAQAAAATSVPIMAQFAATCSAYASSGWHAVCVWATAFWKLAVAKWAIFSRIAFELAAAASVAAWQAAVAAWKASPQMAADAWATASQLAAFSALRVSEAWYIGLAAAQAGGMLLGTWLAAAIDAACVGVVEMAAFLKVAFARLTVILIPAASAFAANLAVGAELAFAEARKAAQPLLVHVVARLQILAVLMPTRL